MVEPAPGPLMVECNVDAREDLELLLLGRLRNVRHALVLRHLSSSLSLIAVRYASNPLRRASVSSGEEVVRVNQDFGGRGPWRAVPPAWEVRELWRVVKSE